MIHARALPFLSALLVATAPAAALPNQPTAKLYSDRLAALTPIQRFAALRRAVLDTGLPCRRVAAAARQGPWKNLEMWVVRCEAVPDYSAFLGPDGSVQVSPCAELVKVRLPACRKL